MTLLTATVGFLSNAVCISCTFENSWPIHESLESKPAWDGVKSLLLIKYFKTELLINLSKILLKISTMLTWR